MSPAFSAPPVFLFIQLHQHPGVYATWQSRVPTFKQHAGGRLLIYVSLWDTYFISAICVPGDILDLWFQVSHTHLDPSDCLGPSPKQKP